MKILVLGKGIANDGVVELLRKKDKEFDYFNLDEVKDKDYDLVVKAPGIPYTNTIIEEFLNRNIKVITDIELGMLLCSKYFICVTGSNGKTTTVTLISEILSKEYSVVTCGNIGYSVCRALAEHENADIFVVELSSFQLERSHIDPNISVILPVRPCHLDHHQDYQDYLESKSRITIHQSASHLFIYPYDDPNVKRWLSSSSAKKIAYSTNSYLTQGYVHKGYLCYNGRKVARIPEEAKKKDFLICDMLVAMTACLQVRKINARCIRKAIKSFREVPFRMEKLNSYIYNDAKSTNPYSTIAALKCLQNVELICGGYDRKENLSCLNEDLSRIKKVYAYGESKGKIEQYMVNHQVECQCFNSLEEAFLKALGERKDEIILFSPMFASFDEFKNYIQRGEYFNQLYHKYVK